MAAHSQDNCLEQRLLNSSEPIRVGYLSTYPPRECGLATFCEDLVTATMLGEKAGEPVVVAMENHPDSRDYGWPVARVVDDAADEDYEAAAEFFNESSADVVSLQHEFGIFGGPEGRGLPRLIDRLLKPVVTTLHTVIPDPDSCVRTSIQEVAGKSERVVVMNALAVDILSRDYGVDRRKISLIHHGALPPSLESREQAKARLGLSGRTVLSTFGLVGRGKGLEYALAALPAILRRHPDACYLIVGRTHPDVQRTEKESYREKLLRLVDDLGVQDAVRFVNRYVTRSEIVGFLAATDVYITPYLDPQQITSGTLACAVAAGKAIVSTPYLYARFLLKDDRGLLVDFRSGETIAAAVNGILDHPHLQPKLERRSHVYGQQMLWPNVGAHYIDLFRNVLRDHHAWVAADRRPRLPFSLPTPLAREVQDHGADRSRPARLARPLAAAD